MYIIRAYLFFSPLSTARPLYAVCVLDVSFVCVPYVQTDRISFGRNDNIKKKNIIQRTIIIITRPKREIVLERDRERRLRDVRISRRVMWFIIIILYPRETRGVFNYDLTSSDFFFMVSLCARFFLFFFIII